MAGNPLCFPELGARGQPAEPRPVRPPRKPLVLHIPRGKKELRGEGWTGTFLKLWGKLSFLVRFLLLKEGVKLCKMMTTFSPSIILTLFSGDAGFSLHLFYFVL